MTMMNLKISVFLWMTLICGYVSGQLDPCTTATDVPYGVHKGLRGSDKTSGSNLICDYSITPGWYNYLAQAPATGNPISLEIPTKCVPVYRCGTAYPVWINGNTPLPADGIVTRDACMSVNIGGLNPCHCNFKFQIQVKNCGNDKIVYNLKQTPGCPVAYCFDGKKCPPPSTGVFPNCLPSLPFDPTLTLENENNAALNVIKFTCSITLAQVNAKLQVEWLADTSIIHTQTGTPVIGLNSFTLPEAKLLSQLGKSLTCRMRPFLVNGGSGPWRTSQKKLLGIKILNYDGTKIKLDEGQTFELQLKAAIPYLGAFFPLKVSVAVPFGALGNVHCATGEPIDQLVTDTCGIEILRNDWKKIHRLKIAASVDNKVEKTSQALRRVHLKTPPLVFGHMVWGGYRLPEVQILVQDKDVKKMPRCHSVNDPHMRMFDGTYYEHQLSGYFVLYRHKDIPVEVHAHFLPCNNNGKAPTCNCAVGILTGNDVIIFDKCSRGTIDVTCANNRLRVTAVGKGDSRGTRILRENGGKKYTVILPTGTQIEIRDSWRNFINIYITASAMDLKKTEGLCGSFDYNCANDLIPRGQTTLPPNYSSANCRATPRHPLLFSESYRIQPSKTFLYWNGQFVDNRQAAYDGHVYCTCKGTTPLLTCAPAGDVPKCKLKPGQTNVTPTLLGNACKRRSVERHDHFDFLDYDETEYSEVTRSAMIELGIEKQHQRVKRQARITEAEARRHCENFVKNTTASERCEALEVNFNEPINACVFDLMATGDKNWATAALDTVKQECLTVLDRDTTRWVQPKGSNFAIPPPHIIDVICDNECSNHGECIQGMCKCDPGYASPDCSIDTNKAPLVYYTPRCETDKRQCERNPVIGNNFLENNRLTCHIRETGINEHGEYNGNNAAQVNTAAQFISYGEVICPLPPKASLTMSRGVGEATAFRVAISNNGLLRSNEALLIVHDPGVLMCDVGAAKCFQKNKGVHAEVVEKQTLEVPEEAECGKEYTLRVKGGKVKLTNPTNREIKIKLTTTITDDKGNTKSETKEYTVPAGKSTTVVPPEAEMKVKYEKAGKVKVSRKLTMSTANKRKRRASAVVTTLATATMLLNVFCKNQDVTVRAVENFRVVGPRRGVCNRQYTFRLEGRFRLNNPTNRPVTIDATYTLRDSRGHTRTVTRTYVVPAGGSIDVKPDATLQVTYRRPGLVRFTGTATFTRRGRKRSIGNSVIFTTTVESSTTITCPEIQSWCRSQGGIFSTVPGSRCRQYTVQATFTHSNTSTHSPTITDSQIRTCPRGLTFDTRVCRCNYGDVPCAIQGGPM